MLFCNSFNWSLPISCSIIQKAGNVLEVLKEVLDAVDSQHPEVYFWSIILDYKFCLAKS